MNSVSQDGKVITESRQAEASRPDTSARATSTAVAPGQSDERPAAPAPPTADDRDSVAVNRCQHMITWYEKRLAYTRRMYTVLQVLVIVLTASIPVVAILLNAPVWQAALAVVASLAATLLATFKWKEDWIRYTVSAEALRSELTKFKTRTTQDYSMELDRNKALDNFVFRIENIAASEVTEWRAQLVQKAGGERPGETGGTPQPVAPKA